MKPLVTAVAVPCFYLFFYRFVVKHWGRAVQAVLAPLHLERRHSRREVDAVGKLAAAAVAQLMFGAVLLLVSGENFAAMIGWQPDLVLLGALLGIGEFALAGFLCTIALEFAAGAASAPGGWAARDWLVRARGGWMSYFVATARAAPAWLAAVTICLYVAVEELVFRGILVSTWAPQGGAVAIALSTTLFVLVQAVAMPGARSAMFPMIGAAVVGPVHAILFWHVPDLVPLVVAHLVFFSGTLGFASRSAPIGILRQAG